MRVMIDIPNNARRMANLRLLHSISRFFMLSALVWATFWTSPVSALLTQDSVVSILNRTARVQPDGSWRIDNEPANFGAVRARATCVEGGVTLSGQSGLFDVEEGIVNGFDAETVLGSATPIPVSLAVSAPASTLTSASVTLCLEPALPE